MKDLVQRIIQELINELSNDSKDILIIGTTDDYNVTNENTKIISINDRIPSKNFDLIIINSLENITEKSQRSKILKYAAKYNKYLLVLDNLEIIDSSIIKDYPSSYIGISSSAILGHYSQFVDLSKKHKELQKSQEKIQAFIKDNVFALNTVQFANSEEPDADILLLFKTFDLKDKFQESIRSQIDNSKTNEFYDLTLKEYSINIDRRNIRFKNNIKYLLQLLKSGSTSVVNKVKQQRNDIQTRIKDNKLNIKSVLPKKQFIKKKKINSQGSKLLNKFKFNFEKLRFKIYKKNTKQIRKITYEEFINRSKIGNIQNFRNERILHGFKYTPIISIIVVIDDIDEIWLNKSVRTIKDQLYKKWELILVDNCSERTFIKSYLSALNDPRVKTFFYNTKKTYAESIAQAYKISKGEFITILGQGDELDTNSLFHLVKELNIDNSIDIAYTDSDKINEQSKRVSPFFKSEFDKTMLLSHPYIDKSLFIKKDIVDRVSGFKNYNIKDPIWDLILKIRDNDLNTKHIPLILYHQRIFPLKKDDSVRNTDALKNYLHKNNIQADIKESFTNKDIYYIEKKSKTDKISIILFDNKFQYFDTFLKRLNILNYKNYDINIGTTSNKIYSGNNIKTFKFDTFDFANMANLISKEVEGKYILFLDSRLKILNPDFLTIMYSYVDDKAIVGTKILDIDNIVQHSLYVKNLIYPISTIYEGELDKGQYEINITREATAVSKKAMLIEKELFIENQFDNYKGSYHDIDLCLSLNKNQVRVILAPEAKLYTNTPFKKEVFNEADTIKFIKKWNDELKIADTHVNVDLFSLIKL